jgi:UDP-GlcNAc:undecaprenyl-phosphate/decaprenyl-phosphate GlcNAc-1-phosphate transferase
LYLKIRIGLEYILLSFFTSFFIVLMVTPVLIKVAILKGLTDEPGDLRKLHTRRIPSIGGIIIFAGTLFAYSLWFPGFLPDNLKYVVAVGLLLFFVGVKDDIIGTAPVKKLAAHVIAGLILVLMADVRLTSLHGLFGIREIPEWAGIFLSLYVYIVIVNAFNLIDGVDGLASGVGVISSSAFGVWFIVAGDYDMATLSFALCGSLLGFLKYNFNPASIFLGDSGSLTIGFIFSLLAIKLVEFKTAYLPMELMNISKPIFALAVLVYPLMDTLRIFIYRIVRGTSPFAADKNHLHHRLLDIGLTAKQTVGVICLYNIVVIGVALMVEGTGTTLSFMLVAGVAIGLAQVPFFFPKIKNRQNLESV